MMKLSVMLRVDSAIDADGGSHLAERILEQWEHEPGSARFFRSSANFVYTFRAGGERRFLRFAERDERAEAAISAEIALLRWLASQGMRVASPLASSQGRWVETVETDLGTFHMVVFAQLPGAQLEVEELNAGQFERWGAALGQLHTAMRRYLDSEAPARQTWRDYLALARSVAAHDELRVQAECDYLTTWLEALPVTETTYGLIHGDFELDNLFWQDDGAIAALDFDDCFQCWHMADIAFAVRDLCESGVDLTAPPLRAFLDGYAQYAALGEEQIAQLPTWMRLVDLIMYAKLARAMDLAPNLGHPEWMNALVARLRQRMSDYRALLRAIPV